MGEEGDQHVFLLLGGLHRPRRGVGLTPAVHQKVLQPEGPWMSFAVSVHFRQHPGPEGGPPIVPGLGLLPGLGQGPELDQGQAPKVSVGEP
jgi:hypothetical protein